MATNRRTVASIAAGVGAGFAVRTLLRWRKRQDFKDQVVVITGGSRGLGLILARFLADEGAKLALLARDPDELERAEKDVTSRGTEVLSIQCNVRDRISVEDAIRRVMDHFGRIDVLINNAGIIQVGPADHMQLDDYEIAMATNLWGALYTIRACVPHMTAQGAGRIVNISSIGGLVSVPHMTPYSTSKHALVGLSKGLQAELAKDNIAVTTVCPGELRTGSPPNASFKGRHEDEYAWFAVGDSVPGSAISANRAAKQILSACRYRQPFLIISLQARLIHYASALAPNLFARVMLQVDKMLPPPTGTWGDTTKTGWQSMSDRAPKVLTQFSDRATAKNNELKGPQPLG